MAETVSASFCNIVESLWTLEILTPPTLQTKENSPLATARFTTGIALAMSGPVTESATTLATFFFLFVVCTIIPSDSTI